jgi:KDO2-lipid IV(A) lauroyltransferase
MLTISFPEKSTTEIRFIAKNVYKNFLRTIVEVIYFPIMSYREIKKLLICTNAHLIKDFYTAGKGIVLMSAHLGNWELAALIFSKIYPISVIVANQANQFVNKIINDIRTQKDYKTINKDNMNIKTILKCLKKNEILAILSDQDAGQNGVFVPFFGRLASTPKGAAYFAITAKCPIIIALSTRQKNGTIKVEFTEVPMPNTGNKETDIKIINSFYSKKLEEAVRKNPEQWFWFHRKWNTRPTISKKLTS